MTVTSFNFAQFKRQETKVLEEQEKLLVTVLKKKKESL